MPLCVYIVEGTDICMYVQLKK